MRDLAGILDAILAGIVVLDERGQVVLVNAAACRMLESSAEALTGLPVDRLRGADHAVAKLAVRVLETGRSAVETEHPLRRRFDEDLVVDVTASPLFEDDKPHGAVVELRDRTIQRRLEHRATERERLSAFARIAAGVAHEVKNPLGGIRGAAEILASRVSDPKTADAAELIVREVERIAGLVDDLMVFTRSDDVSFAPVNIHRVLDEVLELLAMDPLSSGITVMRNFDPSIPEIQADADRLAQVFLNLIRNALQAMEGGRGTLTIATRMNLDERLSTSAERSLPALLIEVTDTGPGIEPEVMEALATPFFTTRAGGTGLGLAVSRQWVTRHGGTLHLDSEPGRGATARVALPLRRTAR